MSHFSIKKKSEDLSSAVKKKKFSLQQNMINKELASKFTKTYSSYYKNAAHKKLRNLKQHANAKASDLLSSSKRLIPEPKKRKKVQPHPHQGVQYNKLTIEYKQNRALGVGGGSKTSRSNYSSKEVMAPLNLLAERMGIKLKNLRRIGNLGNQRLYSNQQIATTARKSTSNAKTAVKKRDKNYNSMKLKEKRLASIKNSLVTGSKFNILMNRELKVRTTSKDRLDFSSRLQTSRTARNKTVNSKGLGNAFNQSRKSMNSIYDKQYKKRFKRVTSTKQTKRMYSQSDARPLMSSIREKGSLLGIGRERSRNRKSTLSTARISNNTFKRG